MSGVDKFPLNIVNLYKSKAQSRTNTRHGIIAALR